MLSPERINRQQQREFESERWKITIRVRKTNNHTANFTKAANKIHNEQSQTNVTPSPSGLISVPFKMAACFTPLSFVKNLISFV